MVINQDFYPAILLVLAFKSTLCDVNFDPEGFAVDI